MTRSHLSLCVTATTTESWRGQTCSRHHYQACAAAERRSRLQCAEHLSQLGQQNVDYSLRHARTVVQSISGALHSTRLRPCPQIQRLVCSKPWCEQQPVYHFSVAVQSCCRHCAPLVSSSEELRHNLARGHPPCLRLRTLLHIWSLDRSRVTRELYAVAALSGVITLRRAPMEHVRYTIQTRSRYITETQTSQRRGVERRRPHRCWALLATSCTAQWHLPADMGAWSPGQ